MCFRMKTTLGIDDGVMRSLKEEAARSGKTLSELMEGALRKMLSELSEPARKLPPLPHFRSRALVDSSDREALYEAMEGPQ